MGYQCLETPLSHAYKLRDENMIQLLKRYGACK